MVSVSVVPARLVSAIAAPANGLTGALATVLACVPLNVGSAASKLLTLVVLSLTLELNSAELVSVSVKVVVGFDAPAAGVNTSASSSAVIAAAVPTRV